jgi:hypothetical protein
MPNLIGPNTVDTTSTNGACVYPAKPLGNTAYVSPNVFINKQPLNFFHAAVAPDTVTGQPTNPLVPCVIPEAPRVLLNKVNTSVYINKYLPLVQGDIAQALGTDRPLVGPYQHPTVFIANKPK